jgi:amidophosphoribosyltransferase
MAFLALYALQHRGQESAGICAIDDGTARLHKRLGLASEIFDADVLERLSGSTAVGHVRYSTAGGGQLANAQPIMVRYAEGDLAIAHNGNLTNARDIRNRLVQEGAIFQTDSDSEVIIHLIARSRRETIEGQIDDALTYLEGAFSVIISIGDTLFAVALRRPGSQGVPAPGAGEERRWLRGGQRDLRAGHHQRRVRPGRVSG